ncbi:MAG: DinB family protein [Acidobacteria bacterium]|nr:DinB family protein [Acidobacteriota bacterium]
MGHLKTRGWTPASSKGEVEGVWKGAVGRQFGAALEMLENAVRACPDKLWGDRGRRPEFWYVVYHTLFYLDLYLHGSTEGFAPPEPFTLDELDPAGRLPERVYTKDELLAYLLRCREKCRAVVAALTDETARARRVFEWVELDACELLLYNLRHVQHHAAQLNLLLRQETDDAPRWVASAMD